MKKIFLSLCVLVIYTHAFAQEDSVTIIKAPTLTEIGKPIGEKVSQKLNKDGGRISSADGRLELIVPQDALSSKTTISIQPINNTLSPGSGNAYELEPSGITFQKPLQIIFHYSQKEILGVMPELKGIAWQDDKGQWYRLKNTTADTAAKTVTGSITHFSSWVSFDLFQMVPTSAKVKVTKQLTLHIILEAPPDEKSSESKDADLLNSPQKNYSCVTYVNGIRSGNSIVGTISNPGSGSSLKFTAPASVPDMNPVDVSLEANASFTFNGTTYNRLKLVSHITIIDKSFEITVIGHNKQNTYSCTITSIDSSTCILQLNGNKSKLQDIQNMNFKLSISGCPCKVTEMNAGSSVGQVNLLGATKIDVVPATPRKSLLHL